MTEQEMEKAEFIRDSLREDGVVIKPEPYPKPFSKWYTELVEDIDKGEA